MGPDGGVENPRITPSSFGVDRQPRGVSEQREPNRLNIESAGLSVASALHPEINEDSILRLENGVAGVFDGVGGKEGGDHAARTARDEIGRYIIEAMRNYPHGFLTSSEAEKIAREAIREANNVVFRKRGEVIQGEIYPEMSTTACIVVPYQEKRMENGREITVDGVVVANVGDSRAYLQRDGQLKQLTLDDNLVKSHVKDKNIADKIQSKLSKVTDPKNLNEILRYYYENRNVITKALGDQMVDPSLVFVELKPGDRIFLCTDGISDNLTDEEMKRILAYNPDPTKAVQELINKAQARARSPHPRAKPDDMTAVVLSFGSHESPSSSYVHLSPHSSEDSVPSLSKVLKGLFEEVKLPNNQTEDIKPGSKVVVVEFDGNVDKQLWKVAKIDPLTGSAVVVKIKSNGFSERSVPLKTLYAWNRSTTLLDIKDAANRSQLYWILARLKDKGIQGSQVFYSSEELINLVNGFFAAEFPLNAITRFGNLRETVFNLMIEEIKAGKISKEILSEIYKRNPGIDIEIKKRLREKGFFREFDEILP